MTPIILIGLIIIVSGWISIDAYLKKEFETAVIYGFVFGLSIGVEFALIMIRIYSNMVNELYQLIQQA